MDKNVVDKNLFLRVGRIEIVVKLVRVPIPTITRSFGRLRYSLDCVR